MTWNAGEVAVQVTLSTSSFFPDTEQAFRAAAEHGYDGVEVMVNHDRRSQTVEGVQALASAYRVPVKSVHVPCLAITQHVWGFNPEQKLRRSVEMARAVSAEVVVVHPPFRWQREYGRIFVELIAEFRGNGGPIVSVENMYAVDALGRRVNPYLHTDDPSLHAFDALTFDTSHAAAARWDILDLYELFDGRVAHVHLSDSTGQKGDEHLPPGTGRLPLDALAARIKKAGYDGHVVLECGFQRLPESARMPASQDSRNYAVAAFGGG